MKKLLLLPVCVLVLCMTVPASFVFAEEELSSEVSCGGIITLFRDKDYSLLFRLWYFTVTKILPPLMPACRNIDRCWHL